MADVNVEFGAKDTGLEATLKTVQEQMTKLEAEVKSGTLSFDELSQKMRQLSQAEKIDQKLRDIGTASAEARPNVDALGNAVLDAGKKSDQSAGIFDSSFQKIAGAFTAGNLAAEAFQKVIDLAFGAARAVVDAFGQALDLGGRLNELSARTGETAGQLLILEQAFRDSGLSADQVGVAINKLQNFMAEAQAGGDAQTQAMQRLGISMADLAGKTPTQQMEVFAQAISKIEDPTQRAAIAGDVFGEKLGGRLLPLLTQFSPALDDAGTKVGSLADVMDENAAIFDQTGETIEAVQGKLAAFAAGILGETIPAIQGMGTAMEEVDAAGFGEKIGEMIAPSLRSVTAQIDLLNQGLGFLGQKLKEISGIGSQSSQEFEFMGLKFGEVAGIIGQALPSQFLPLKLALQGIGEQSRESTVAQGEAAAAIEQTGNKAAEATPKLQEMVQGASDLPAAFESTLPLVGEFNAQLDQSAPFMDGIKAQSSLIKDDFSEIVTLSAQLPGEFDAQTQSIGGVTDQLELQKELYELIAPKVEEVREDIVKTEENINGATEKIKEFKSFVDLIAASSPDEPIKSLSEKSADARKEIEAFGKYIGEDLKGMSMPDVAKKLGVDTLGMDGSEQIDAIVRHIEKELPKAKQGVVDEDASKAAVSATAKKAGEDLKKALDYSVQTGEGGKILADIKSLVDTIKGYTEVIRDRLPLRALA